MLWQHHNYKGRLTSFTLVELLVVIGICVSIWRDSGFGKVDFSDEKDQIQTVLRNFKIGLDKYWKVGKIRI